MFWFFGHGTCGILAPQPGIEPPSPALEGKVLTTGPPGKSLSLSFLRITLPDRIFLVDRFWVFFFLSALWICHPTLSWPVRFLLRNPLIVLWGSFVSGKVLFYCFFQDFLFVFDFYSFITMCLGEALFELNLFADLWASWTWMSKSLFRFVKFSDIIWGGGLLRILHINLWGHGGGCTYKHLVYNKKKVNGPGRRLEDGNTRFSNHLEKLRQQQLIGEVKLTPLYFYGRLVV